MTREGGTRFDPLQADGTEKPACPRCNGFRIHRRTRRAGEEGEGKWRCQACEETFDTPAYAVPEHSSPVLRPYISAAGEAALEWTETEE